jgi:phosphatidylglycerol:prolipoprotein diacylglycerol transferase
MTYAAVMLLAVAAAAALGRGRQAELGLTAAQRRGLTAGALCGGVAGAKLPFLLSDWPAFVSGAAWFGDGKTILTGLVGGYLGVEAAKWSLDVRTKTGDAFVVPVATAVGLGRLACLAGGCCYGTPTALPWGVVFASVDGLARHPTQLYEAAFHLLAAAQCELWRRSGAFRGSLFKAYVMAYAVFRFATEWLRPEPRWPGGFTAYQAACAVIALWMAWLWRRDLRHAARDRAETTAIG